MAGARLIYPDRKRWKECKEPESQELVRRMKVEQNESGVQVLETQNTLEAQRVFARGKPLNRTRIDFSRSILGCTVPSSR